MTDNTHDDELIRRAAGHHAVPPELLTSLLALAPRFENFNIYGARVDFARAVERILDGTGPDQNSGSAL